MSWTDDRIALLKKMWKDGKSAADIAKSLGKGVTRNAVIGKAHRMGLSGRPAAPAPAPAAPAGKAAKKPAATAKAPAAPAPKKDAKAAAKPAPKPAPAKAPAAEARKPGAAVLPALKKKPQPGSGPRPPDEAPILVREIPPPGGGVALIDLTERMCKWPIGDPREDGFTFCGSSPVRAGTPYCPTHASMAYQSSSRRGAPVAVEEKEEPAEEKEIDVEEPDEDDIGTVA